VAGLPCSREYLSLQGLLAESDRCRAMLAESFGGENGRRLVAAEFSVDAMVDRVNGTIRAQ